MTYPTAEVRRIGVVISLVAADRNERDHDQRSQAEDDQSFAMAGITDVQVRKPGNTREVDALPALPPPLEQPSDRNQQESENQNRRNNQKGPQPGIRVAAALDDVDELETDEEEYGQDGQYGSRHGRRILPCRLQKFHRGSPSQNFLSISSYSRGCFSISSLRLILPVSQTRLIGKTKGDKCTLYMCQMIIARKARIAS